MSTKHQKHPIARAMQRGADLLLAGAVVGAGLLFAPIAQAAGASGYASFDVVTGNKHYTETDYSDFHGQLKFVRYHNSSLNRQGMMGILWRHNFETTAAVDIRGGRLVFARPTGASYFFNAGITVGADGESYTATPGIYKSPKSGINDSVIVEVDTAGQISRLIYRNTEEGREEIFDAQLHLVKYVWRDGYTQNITRSAEGWITSVTDSNGRSLSFTYGTFGENVQLTGISDSSGHSVTYGYSSLDTRILLKVTDPNGRATDYMMHSPSEYGKSTQYYMVRDVTGEVRDFNYYDGNGNGAAWYSTVPGGVVGPLLHVTRTPKPDGSLEIDVNRHGLVHKRTYARVGGRFQLIKQDNPAGSGCAASTSLREYDAYGYVKAEDDFNGNRTCTKFDPDRGVATVAVQGLPAGADCDSVLAGGSLSGDARKTTTAFHPVWNLPVRVASARAITSYVYHGQPDPTGGTASCTTAANMPSGIVPAVLCKVVVQASTDASGAQGLAAVVDATVPARVTAYEYNAGGYVTKVTDPAGQVKTIEYDGRNNVAKTIDAKGFATTFDSYNPRGQLLSKTDPNGLVSSWSFDAAGYLLNETVDGDVTVYEHAGDGIPTKVTNPDGSYKVFAHDPSYYVMSITNNFGHSVEFQRHANGTAVKTRFKYGNQYDVREIQQGVDPLGRIHQTIGVR